MSPSIIIALIYGILALAGGIVGYLKAGSMTSLISGIVSGFLLLICAVRAALGFASGLWVVKAFSLLLVIVFFVRLLKTKKFMPAGLMVIGGAVTLGGAFV